MAAWGAIVSIALLVAGCSRNCSDPDVGAVSPDLPVAVPSGTGILAIDMPGIWTIQDTVIVETGASSKKEMGSVMKEVLSRIGGRADGKAVSRIVGSRLT